MCRLDNTTIMGEDVHVKEEVYTNGATVLPHKSVKEDINDAQIVM
jgi:mannose-1-phosphate guanylyltransferase